MGELDEILKKIKEQPGKRYRMISLDEANVGIKKFRGFHFVLAGDPEVKGTALEEQKAPDGKIKMGGLALARISDDAAERHAKKVAERTDAKLRMVKSTYLKEGETIKRQMGKDHKHFEAFVDEE